MEKKGILSSVNVGGIVSGQPNLVALRIRIANENEGFHTETFVLKRGQDISDKDLMALINKVGEEITLNVSVEIKI